MPFRFCSWMLALTAGSVLVISCRTQNASNTALSDSPDKVQASSPRGSRAAVARSQKDSSTNRPPERKRVFDRSASIQDYVDEGQAEAHAHFGAAVIHELEGAPELALKEYYQAAMKDPGNAALVLEVSRQLLFAKQPEKALELLLYATRRPNPPGVLYARLGYVYTQLSQSEAAIKASRVAIKKEPRMLAGYQSLFLNYLQTAREQEALDALNEAAAVAQTDAEFLVSLAELYLNLSMQAPSKKEVAQARAKEVLQRVEKLNPTDVQLRLRYADSLNILGAEAQASQQYEAVLKASSSSYFQRNIRQKLANIYIRAKRNKEASEQLEAIVRDYPTDPQAYILLGNLAMDDKDYAKAADHFTRALLVSPDAEAVHYDLVGAQIGADRFKEAQMTIERARLKFAPHFLLEYYSGLVASRQEDFTNAMSKFAAAEIMAQGDAKKTDSVFYFEFGAACERAGDYAQAEKHLEKALQLAPDFADAMNYLGYMLADRGEKLDRARELIEKALKAEPESAAYLDSMGWVLFKLNQPAQALEFMLKAVKLSEKEDAVLYDHLGDIYAALQQNQKAEEAWRKSLALEPNDKVRKKLEPAATKASSETPRP